MSTLRSSSENLTINADGASSGIIFQNDGTTSVTIDTSGNVAVGSSLTLKQDGSISSDAHSFKNVAGTEHLSITSDGRGLSKFTAKAWANWNGQGTPAIRDSHNVSSITDIGTGIYDINFTNALASSDYAVVYDAQAVATNNANTTYASVYTTTSFRTNHFEANTTRDPAQNSAIVFGG